MGESRVAKSCPCCRREYTAAAFAELQLVGWVGAFWRDGRAMAVEMRNCSCGSTIGMESRAPKKLAQANAEAKLARRSAA